MVPLVSYRYLAPLFQLGILTSVLLRLSARNRPHDHESDDQAHGLVIEECSSLLSRWTFAWVSPVVWKAYSNTLTSADLYPLAWDDRADVATQRLSSATPKASALLWRLFRWARSDLAYQGAWATLFSAIILCPAILLRGILNYMAAPSANSRNDAWICVGGLLLSGIMTGVAECQCEWVGRKISLRLRAILIDQIFQKMLRRRLIIPETSLQESEQLAGDAGDGAVMNLMTADTASISEVGAHMHFVWINFPLQLIIATSVLYSLLGLSGLFGVLMMILLLPLNVVVSKRQVTAQAKTLSAADARVQVSNELISNIRVIKLCNLEKVFRDKVRNLRKKELAELQRRFLWWSISMTVFYALPFVTTILTLFLYTIVERRSLETKVAFPAIAIFAVLRIPLDRISAMISFMLQAHVSIGRVESFLGGQEISRQRHVSNFTDHPVGFNNASLHWTATESHILTTNDDLELAELGSARSLFRLSNIKIEFHSFALNVILGASGSGKSSLLSAMLGEMQLLHGRSSDSVHDLPRTAVAYCSQQPWILNTTIRANILFGLPMRSQRYITVLDAVALSADLGAFADRDLTLAGERGTRLSGGQRQRVSLARALYSNTQYLILDDCLSGLDSRTAKHVFFHGIMGSLAKGRTCILATHNGQLVVPYCQHAVLLEDGQVKTQGPPSHMKHTGIGVPDTSNDETSPMVPRAANADANGTSSEAEMFRLPPAIDDQPDGSDIKAEYTEEISSGAVPFSVVKTYLSSMGKSWFWIVILVAFALQQIASLGTNLWIKTWANKFDAAISQDAALANSDPIATVNSGYYLAIYGMICLSYVAVSFVRDLAALSGALKASLQLFDKLLDSILHADIVFLDKVPFGQIANRFSRDISVIDQEVTLHSLSTLYTLCSLVTVIVLISALLPMFLPAAAIICAVYWLISNTYISSARDLKRLEAVGSSPLYQHLGAASLGCASIRAYGQGTRFIDDNRDLINSFNQPYYLLWAAKEWLTIRVACVSAIISWLTGTLLMLGVDGGSVSTGVAGLILTYAATFTDNVLWLVQLYAIVQQSFNSVERVDEYTKIRPEPTEPLERPIYDLSPDWPTRGHVSFHGYCTSYMVGGDLVLKDVSFEIPAGKRVAVVGRTGAGKSTLALALVRAVEATSGSINIDGINIASVTLQQLRQAVSVVPQDPTLFDGNLRENLDPWHSHSDADLIGVLREVQFFRSLPSGRLEDPASILSLGQRQLVCIARVLLRRSRILVLDEATASIDHTTDALVQTALRSGLVAGVSVLTIAHRLKSIIDYDCVIVLGNGSVVEEGTVTKLISRRGPDAFFRRLCEQTGDLEAIEAAMSSGHNVGS
ncbi:hypothetical protein LTR86_001312 [Recurvomyces mirabilis]|nr:hypothetical protein LTR86_001312 [Recurvomyces mirabilis]